MLLRISFYSLPTNQFSLRTLRGYHDLPHISMNIYLIYSTAYVHISVIVNIILTIGPLLGVRFSS